MHKSIFWLIVPGLAAAGGCGTEPTTGAGPTPVCSSAAATPLALLANADTAIDPALDSGCVTFAASTGDSAEYLIVAQSAGGIPGDTGSFALRAAQLAAMMAANRQSPGHPLVPTMRRVRRGPNAVAFDRRLRGLERSSHSGVSAHAMTREPEVARAAVTGIVRPSVGSLRAFSVCADLECNTSKAVTARVRSVGTNVAIYVDTLAPSNGLDSAQLDSLQQVFDDHVYAVDTAAFGGVSDIDSNGVVLTLMTPTVNSLVNTAECELGGFVAGFFYPPDLDPATAAQNNDGEIFYTIVADPNGAVSCPHTTVDLEQSLPETFLHELQHVISFNQHVLVRGGQPEDLWLDEALSSLGEELGGRSFLPDTTTFSIYASEDLYDAYQYFLDPGDHFLLQTSDTILPDFGAGWLYARYLVDQFGPQLTRQLEQTTLTGTDNVAAQTGLPFATTATRWALANWTSDLPGFAPPTGLFYRSWSFRSVFSSFYSQDPLDFPLPFPLVPVRVVGNQLNVGGTLHAGSGFYVDVLQAPGAASFTLHFGGQSAPLPSTLVPRLAIVRLR